MLLSFVPFVVPALALTVPSTLSVCQAIAKGIAGGVYYPGSLSTNYVTDIDHYLLSSNQLPTCVVEVTSAQDVSAVLKQVATSRTPFAIKSGGHASNPGFSSTTGVHISLARLKNVTLSADKQFVTLGMGNIWTDAYDALDGSGVNVVGGRVTGPGTGGFTLGGGYSWLTDQYGLTCDTVESFELVLPNGTITQVDSTKPDVFFALKGGLNRFGVVTQTKYRTVPQPATVYGGLQVFDGTKIPALINATETFQKTNTDPKAQVILTMNGGPTGPSAILLSFYDGPGRPAAFAPYDGIVPLVSNLASQSFASYVKSTPSQLSGGINRGAFQTLSTTSLTAGFMQAVHNESLYYSSLALLHSATLLSYDVEPFLNYGQYATDSAFPHEKSPLPLNLYFGWSNPLEDDFWRKAMQTSVDHLTEVAKAEGIYSADLYAYPNYALSTYSGAQLYGPTNAARLLSIQKQIDPTGIMTLAGGFSFS